MPFKSILSCFTACFRPKKQDCCCNIREDPDGVIPVAPALHDPEDLADVTPAVTRAFTDIAPEILNDGNDVISDTDSVVPVSETPMAVLEKTPKVVAGLGSGDAATEEPDAPGAQQLSMVEEDPSEPEPPKCNLSIWLRQEFVPPPPSKAIIELEERIRAQLFRFPRIQQDWLRKQILKKNWIRSVQKIHQEVSSALPLYLQTEEKIEREKAQAFQQAKSKHPDCKWRAFVFPRMPSDWLRKQILREAFMDDVRGAYRGLQKVLPLYNATMETLCAAEGETLED